MSVSSKISVGSLELEFSTAKILGAVGALLSLIGLFFLLLSPLLSLLLSIVGVILGLISLNYFSKLYGNPSIYTSYLYSVVLGIVAGVLDLFGFGGAGIAPFLLFDPREGELEELVYVGLLSLGMLALAALLSALLFLGAMFFYYRALASMAVSSRVELFRYAGLSGLLGGGLIFAGMLFLIILIGFLFMLLGYLALIASDILLLFAFLEIKGPQPSPPAQPIAPAAPA